MVWQPEIDELKRRRAFAEEMGGEAGIAEQRRRGKLTVRERIDLLADQGSFQEIGQLAGAATYEGNELKHVRPSNMIIGLGGLNGRKAVLTAGDFTVRGGSADGSIGNKGGHAQKMALDWRLPFVRLLDATGGSVRTFENIGRTYIPTNPVTPGVEDLLCRVPVVAAVLGSVAGLPAVDACLAHFNVMVKGTSQVFPGGPPVVKAALGIDITKEDLGDERSQVYEAGVVDNLVDTEAEAFDMVKRFLSYLPDNVWQMPPRRDAGDDPDRRDDSLLSAIPREKRRVYDAYKILNAVLDRESFFEITPFYGRSRVVGLGRVDGYPVGVMINNPKRLGGSMDVAAGTKVIRFLQLCDTFHLPMVYFADEPGFMVGPGTAAPRHRARRRQDAVCDAAHAHAVDYRHHPPTVRRCRAMPRPPERHVQARRVAVRALGLDAHIGRRIGGVSPCHSRVGRPPRPRKRRSKPSSKRCRRRSRPPRRSTSRTSSTRAIRARWLASSCTWRSRCWSPNSDRVRHRTCRRARLAGKRQSYVANSEQIRTHAKSVLQDGWPMSYG